MTKGEARGVELPTQKVCQAPLVVAVVLTWNDTELTTGCLESVFASDYENIRVVLVDNGSVPPRGPDLKEAFPEVELVQLEKNQGFSGGANRGMEKALEMSADYVHLIGNDSTLSQDAISLLVSEFEKRPEVGAASPLLLFTGSEPVVQFYNASLNRDLALHKHFHVGEPYEKGAWPVTESEFIPCVALCFRASALRDVGLLDESFGTSWEDYDICVRFHDRGWKYITVGDANAVHIGGYTTGGVDSPYITYYMTRNRLICLHRYAGKNVWFRRGFVVIRSFWNNQVKRNGLGNWACHLAFLKGLMHFVFNLQGERDQKHTGRIPGEHWRGISS